MESITFQYMFILFLSMIPFFEVFVTIPTGIIVFNLPPITVLLVAIMGNVLSVLCFIFFGSKINYFVNKILHKFGMQGNRRKDMNPRMKKIFNRFGVSGVCFLSSLLFSSQIGSGAMVTLGAQRRQVFIWTNLGVSTLAIIMAILSVLAEGFVLSLVS